MLWIDSARLESGPHRRRSVPPLAVHAGSDSSRRRRRPDRYSGFWPRNRRCHRHAALGSDRAGRAGRHLAEKSGIINIGLEGLLIISAFAAIFGADATGSLWLGFLIGIVASTLLAGVFAVVCIEFRADQIIAGLAVWLIALGLAPFASQVFYGGPNTSSVGTFDTPVPTTE